MAKYDILLGNLRDRDTSQGGSLAGGSLIGEIKMRTRTIAPLGRLNADGSAVSRSTYALLFAVIGTTYGVGDGATTFNLPDMRGRVPVGQGTGSGLTARVLGYTGGEETHALIVDEIPSHNHIVNAYSIAGNTADPTNAVLANTGASDKEYTNDPTMRNTTMASDMIVDEGGDQPHNNMQPFSVVNYIICYQIV